MRAATIAQAPAKTLETIQIRMNTTGEIRVRTRPEASGNAAASRALLEPENLQGARLQKTCCDIRLPDQIHGGQCERDHNDVGARTGPQKKDNLVKWKCEYKLLVPSLAFLFLLGSYLPVLPGLVQKLPSGFRP
jgi:hypothetical protein